MAKLGGSSLPGIKGVIYRDEAVGKLYAFCTKKCQDEWLQSTDEHKPGATPQRFGCWWCGRSVM